MSGMFSNARLLRHVLTVLTMVPTPDSATVARAELAMERRIMNGGHVLWADNPVTSHFLDPVELRPVFVPPVYDGASQSPTSSLFSHRQCLQPTGTTIPLDHATQSPPSSLLRKATCFHPSESDSTVDPGDVVPASTASDNDISCYEDVYGSFSCYHQPSILDSFKTPSSMTTISASLSASTHATTTTTLFFSSTEYTTSSIPQDDTFESNHTGFLPAWSLDFKTLFGLLFFIVNLVTIVPVFGASSSWFAGGLFNAWTLLVFLVAFIIDQFSITLAMSVGFASRLIGIWFDHGNSGTKRMLRTAFPRFSMLCTYLPALFSFKDPLDILRPVLFGAYNLRFDRPNRKSSKSGDSYSADCYSTDKDSVNKGHSTRSQLDLSLWLETGSSVFEHSVCLYLKTAQPLHVSPPPSPSSSSSSSPSLSESSLSFSESSYDTSCSSGSDESYGSALAIEDFLADFDSPNVCKKQATMSKKGARKIRKPSSQSFSSRSGEMAAATRRKKDARKTRGKSSAQLTSLRSGDTIYQVAAKSHCKWIAMRSVLGEDAETDVQPTCSRKDVDNPSTHELRVSDGLLHQLAIEPTSDGEDNWTLVSRKARKTKSCHF